MKYYRQGKIKSFYGWEVFSIKEKKWWGWKTIATSYSEYDIRRIRIQIEEQGGIFV